MKSKREYEAMAILAPEEAYKVAELEEAIQDRRGEYFSILPGIPMRKFIEQSRNGQLFKPEEIYPEKTTVKQACGVFCMR